MGMILVLTYALGVMVAWIQLQYWFRKEEMTEDVAADLVILSLLSWAIYLVYYIEHKGQDKS